MISKNYLTAEYPLVYTEAGKVRKDRNKGGRVFLGLDKKASTCSNREVLSSTEGVAIESTTTKPSTTI